LAITCLYVRVCSLRNLNLFVITLDSAHTAIINEVIIFIQSILLEYKTHLFMNLPLIILRPSSAHTLLCNKLKSNIVQLSFINHIVQVKTKPCLPTCLTLRGVSLYKIERLKNKKLESNVATQQSIS